MGDKGLEPFAPGFHNRCHSAVFPVFPTVPAWFAIHYKSLQITAITGMVWAKCGHGSPDHRQVEALARPPFHRQILLVVAKQEEEARVLSERSGFQLLDHATLL